MIDLVLSLVHGALGWVIWLIGATVVIIVVSVGALWRKLTGQRPPPPV